jgi:hypothetical protein
VRPNAGKMSLDPAINTFIRPFEMSMTCNLLSILFRSTNQKKNGLSHPIPEMPFNTHSGGYYTIISEAAELYLVLSIILTQ